MTDYVGDALKAGVPAAQLLGFAEHILGKQDNDGLAELNGYARLKTEQLKRREAERQATTGVVEAVQAAIAGATSSQ